VNPSHLLAEPELTAETRTAVGIMGYALYTYHWRANSIRKGGRGPYDDRLGPVSALRRPASHANFKLEVLDNPLRRASGFALLSIVSPNPSSDSCAGSVIVNFILRFADGKN
jgi:hypothetical protein